ncbi:LD-carboxypeptidase [Marinococcus sp. PL1-022]|uniref:S66 peptidase family protein n=1 Tax=Marinococcus sp. PL1-022 TaxID=3095363 RepID=UPI0029C34847|nr:LD-carboxypeptidase [Marinococcus sp. PL1-022]MDX6153117.1 LD-carboxypeptidase [Marinococcus sp. PL1-022]
MIKPEKLEHGDTIGVISTSLPAAATCPRRFQRGIDELKKLGFNVKQGKHCQKNTGHLAGTVEERLQDFHEFIADREVKAVINTVGGYNSNQLLEQLDYELIRKHPKIIMGYSDFTAMLLAIHHETGLVTYAGPSLLPQFGEYGGMMDYTLHAFQSILMHTDTPKVLSSSNYWTSEFLAWDQDDHRERTLIENNGPFMLKKGQAEGKILSGHLGTILSLAGTAFFPDFTEKIVFIEDDHDHPGTFDRYLYHLRHLGTFDKINGMVIGRFHADAALSYPAQLQSVVERATKGYHFPIASNVDFGHTDPMMTIPNGVHARIRMTGNDVQLVLEEQAVEK